MGVSLPDRWAGLMTIAFDGVSLAERKHAVVDFQEEEIGGDVEDGTYDRIGRRLITKIDMDEVDDTKANTIENSSTCSIQNLSKGKTMTVDGIKHVKANLSGRIVQIEVKSEKKTGADARCWSVADTT